VDSAFSDDQDVSSNKEIPAWQQNTLTEESKHISFSFWGKILHYIAIFKILKRSILDLTFASIFALKSQFPRRKSKSLNPHKK
jgi:hypothetical protein